MPAYQVYQHGVLIQTVPSYPRLQVYIKENFSITDLAVLKLHGYDIREVVENESHN